MTVLGRPKDVHRPTGYARYARSAPGMPDGQSTPGANLNVKKEKAWIHSSSICARHSLIQFKIVHRLHMSKTKLSKIFPGVDPICDRCKQAPATLYHTFWSCSRLTAFWSSIFEVYSAISGLAVDPCPFIGLFGVPSEDLPLQNSQLKCIAYSSLLARRLILFNWKNHKPYTFGRWICDVMFFLKVEKICQWGSLMLYGNFLFHMCNN